jgi:DNA repair protein RecO (recombination protein O)
MRQQLLTQGIVLTRTDYGEADRILTILTPDHGKIRVLAKGVRRVKSKLAGGIELFSTSQITFIPGRGEIGTLVSTRLITYYSHIVADLDRTMLGYELLKRLHKITEDAAEPAYYQLLTITLEALNTPALNGELIQLWFDAQLLKLTGHQPNLTTDAKGNKLTAGHEYDFDYNTMSFQPVEQGTYTPAHIKLLRLAFGLQQPFPLQQIQNVSAVLELAQRLVITARQQFLRI